MKAKIFYLWCLCILFLLINFSAAQANVWVQQRWHFKEAYQALLRKDLTTFKQLSAQLQNYPITHYLHYAYLKNHFETEDNQTIQTFLTQYKDTPIARSLQSAWLMHLAKQADWETFLDTYTPQDNTVLQCYHLQAQINTKQVTGVLKSAKQLWLVGKSQPQACDSVFDYLYDREVITDDLRWQRIRLAMQKDNVGLASYLAKGLSNPYKKWVTRWQSMHQDPATALKNFQQSDSPIAREILGYGLKRLARQSAESAYQYWKVFKKKYAFTSLENAELLRYIALQGAKQKPILATQWLDQVDKNLVNEAVNRTKLQVALAQQNWAAIVKLIQSLPTEEQTKHVWQYWQARALEQTGQTEPAEQQFQNLSQHRDYYGFLASDRLGQPYHLQSQPLNIHKDLTQQLLKKHAALLRARELYLVGLTAQARDEWKAVLPTLSVKELKVAATLAHQWGWHDRAIATIAQAQYYNDLKIRFPLPFYDAVMTNAQTQHLEFAWIYAIIRQESAFQTDAISVAGALGLMQLMPKTAKEVAAKHKIELKNTEDVLVPDTNIKLGTLYLRKLLDQFDHNHLLATAAYNAGPSRAKRWAMQQGCLPPDIWVELIPFNQTRDYVQRVLSYTPVFESQMVGHQQVKPMLLDAIQAEGC